VEKNMTPRFIEEKQSFISKENFTLLVALLVSVRRKRGEHYTTAHGERDMSDVLEVLRMAGFTAVAKGLLDSLKRYLNQVP
jgi:hypothetical protein